ncbi:MAG: DEAD/DEAH box helicase [Desulfurellales bacterium]|nr:MAG: DEAD/DEAH box helicase [Desulfurellales bacterium]
MILDYVDSTRSFVLRVPRSDADEIRTLMTEHGLDFSQPASTPSTAVLFTREPFAAASFFRYATPYAYAQLKGIVDEIEKSQAPGSNLHIKCPPDQELWPFQKANIEYALGRTNVLVGDQPGLGKTPTAICFANEIGAKRVLVLCPANIRLQWVRRIREWTTMSWPYHIHPILTSRHGVHPSAQWTVVSYDLARTPAIGRALAAGTYDLLILDEAHYLKESTSGRTRAVFGGGKNREFEPLAQRAGYTMALTGTPLPNRPREAYTLARGLCFDAIDWMSEDDFKERFNPSLRREIITPTGERKFYIDERSGRHFELQNRLRNYFMCRHMKREVMTQLKMPVYDIVHAEEDSLVKQALEAESLLDIDPENLEGADAEALGHVAVVRRMMGIALAPQAAEYVKMLVEGGEEKVVLFAWHIEVLNILQEKLAKYGVLRVDGSTSPKKKEALVERFIKEPEQHVMLGNIQSMGTGTDGLQLVSSHAVIAEASWTPGENIQCFDRLDRGGQTRTVQGDIIVAPGSFSEKVLASALRKNQVIDKALDRRM